MRNANPIDETLNPSQREAVMHRSGPLLIIAGAGSGKTKTLVHRVARLVETGIPADQILLLTFTRKSAQEMIRRAALLADHRANQVSGGTFHAFSAAVLRRHARHIGYTDQFTILDRSDAEDVVQMVRQDPRFAGIGKRFPKKNTLADIFSKVRNTQKPIDYIVGKTCPQYYEFSQEISEIYKAYQLFKQGMQAMDYDDLLIQMARLLDEAPAVRGALQTQFKSVMVDEYQDTNAIQADIIQKLANDERNICVVGDDAQSIYSFRGADFKNIMSFPDLFPGTKIIMLEENYRSTQPILDLTNALIARAKEKYTKKLFTSREGGEKPVYVEVDSENTQSQFICQKVLEAREEGIPLNQMAVLMRSGWHSNDLEVALQSHGIPFVKMGGFRFVEMAHVKDVLAFLRVIQNPRDRVSWQRLLLLLDGVGPKAAQTIWDYIGECLDLGIIPDMQPFRGKPYFGMLSEMVTDIVFCPDVNAIPPSLLLTRVLETYKPIFKQRYEDFHKRQTDLNSLQTIADRYTTIESFLTEMSLEPPDGTQDETRPELLDEKPLVLSTIHSAKGLEWKIVFLICAIDGYLPSTQSMDDLGQIEEERRLMYVALTRAKDQLFVIKPHLDSASHHVYRNSGVRFSRLSRFLTEANIVGNHMTKWVIAQQRQKKGAFGLDALPELDPDLDTRPYVF